MLPFTEAILKGPPGTFGFLLMVPGPAETATAFAYQNPWHLEPTLWLMPLRFDHLSLLRKEVSSGHPDLPQCPSPRREVPRVTVRLAAHL